MINECDNDTWPCFFNPQIGGKKFEESMKNVDDFVHKVCARLSELGFKQTVAFFDENFAASEK